MPQSQPNKKKSGLLFERWPKKALPFLCISLSFRLYFSFSLHNSCQKGVSLRTRATMLFRELRPGVKVVYGCWESRDPSPKWESWVVSRGHDNAATLRRKFLHFNDPPASSLKIQPFLVECGIAASTTVALCRCSRGSYHAVFTVAATFACDVAPQQQNDDYCKALLREFVACVIAGRFPKFPEEEREKDQWECSCNCCSCLVCGGAAAAPARIRRKRFAMAEEEPPRPNAEAATVGFVILHAASPSACLLHLSSSHYRPRRIGANCS